MRFENLRFRATLLLTSLALNACAPVLDSHAWYLSDYKTSMPSLFQPDASARQPDPVPNVKALVAGNTRALFGSTHVTNVGVGPPRPNGYGWTSCVRADVFGITGANLGPQVFLVEIDRGMVGLRRPARLDDRCDSVAYDRI